MASGDRDRSSAPSWEVNLSPGFRADETRYAEFVEMAAALPVPREILQLQLQAIYNHDTKTACPGSSSRPWSSTAPSTASSGSPTAA